MREVDFVPPWYRDLIRRRRSAGGYLVLLTLLLVLVVAGALRRQSEIRAAQREMAAADAETAASRTDLEKLEALRQLRDQWRRQEQVLTSTGVNVEASRLLAALTKVVPPDAALTGISFAVAEPEREVAGAPAPAATAPSVNETAAQASEPRPERRRLNVSLRGVAPGEVAVANVLAGISKQPLFRHVNLTYAKDRQDQDATVREFEVTFVVNLDPDADATAAARDHD
jgi:Tfp pilus assembly protein PilN